MSAIKTNLLAKIFAVYAVVVFALVFAVAIPKDISAQEETLEVETTSVESVEAVAETEEEVTSEVTYRYVAEECDSLTKLVRRAILVYDQANDEIELSKPGIIYAETNIVQNMGAYLLDIGDEVVVNGEDVEKYALSSLDLTQDQIAAWDVYTSSVDFTIPTIQQPENVEEVVEEIKEEIAEENGEAEEVVVEEDEEASAVWWFAGIGGAAVVWYLLWRRKED